MPGPNPKHYKKKVYATRQRQFKSRHTLRFWLMGTILVVSVAMVIALIIYLNNQTDNQNDNEEELFIEEGDVAEIEYKLWADTDRDGVVNWETEEPYQASTFSPNVTEGNMIYGFYSNILGMKIGETKRFFLEANVDLNGDGIDDNTGKKVVSYGNPSSPLFNMSLVFWVRILNITKSTLNAPSAQLNYDIEVLNQLADTLTFYDIYNITC